MVRSVRWLPWLTVLLSAVAARPLSAAEIDKYLLNDTDAVIVLNVKQVIEAPLFKKHYEEVLRKLLGSSAETQQQLKDVGVDPFKDVERIFIVHGESSHRLDPKPGAKGESSLFFIVRGKFDAAKFQAKAEQVAKDYPERFKITKAGTGRLLEVKLADTAYLAMPDSTTIVASFFKEQVLEAIEKGAGTKKTALKFKDVQTLIDKADAKQSLWLVATGRTVHSFDTTVKVINGKKVEVQTKDSLASAGVESVSGGVLMTDGIKTEITVLVKDDKRAKQVAEFVQMDLRDGVERAWKAAIMEKQYDPLREYLRSLATEAKGKKVTIGGEVSAKDFADSFK